MKQKHIVTSLIAGGILVILFAGCSRLGRKLLFHPTHHNATNGLTPWIHEGEIIGYSRTVPSPKAVWLMLHGNAGQASDRTYAVSCFSPDDSVYILEYPGYGKRKGSPSRDSINHAAEKAWSLLRETYKGVPVCVVGESLGSGPASILGGMNPPPDKIVLIVPYDQLALAAREHFPAWMVRLLLKDDWNNIQSLSHYKGLVEIYGAVNDDIIPISHAKALAQSLSGSKLTLIQGGHNDWADEGRIKVRYP